MKRVIPSVILISLLFFFTGCSSEQKSEKKQIKVIAVENFLADIAQNVAGNRIIVDSLFPVGIDPHSFEPSVQDVLKISESAAVIINGGGLEPWIDSLLASTDGERLTIVASEGLKVREEVETAEEHNEEDGHLHEEGDPHFWLDPVLVIQYVNNIRDGFTTLDPQGEAYFAKNAEAYIRKLNDLDKEIRETVSEIPVEKRLLVTNHESFGYFADEYGFKVVGTILLSSSSMADPSAGQLTGLIDEIRKTGSPAIFLETGSNTAVAEQIAKETGVKLVTDLFTHSLTSAEGAAPTYLDMIRHNINTIAAVLK